MEWKIGLGKFNDTRFGTSEALSSVVVAFDVVSKSGSFLLETELIFLFKLILFCRGIVWIDCFLAGEFSRNVRAHSHEKVAPPPPPPVGKAPPPPLSNGNVQQGRRTSSSGDSKPPLPTTTPGEDCAFDELLEGRMDLEVVLPDLKVVRMNVDRRTPMMDFLVQATTSNKISPSGHIINVISKDERNVSYKPNTPIGSLDASTVYIIPKSTLELPVKRMPKLANQPFEQTFRLQVNLPLNQRMVLRVSPRITLAELKSQICAEKELDHSSHHLVHPAQPDTILDLNATLEVYGCAEISLMSNSGLRDSIRNTSTNIFPAPKIEEERRKKSILRIFSRKRKDVTVEVTNDQVPNRIPTSHSENSLVNRNGYQPKQSLKRKPAPAPPPSLARSSSPPLITQSSNSINSRPESEISIKTADEIESTVSHSRHSSDSSGYHEPSVFSDCSENKSPEASIVHGDSVSVNDAIRQNSPLHKDYSDSSATLKRSSMTAKDTNLKNVPSCSTVSISSGSRKRKAPQPPISTLPAIESPSSPNPPSLDQEHVHFPENETTACTIENGTDTSSLQSSQDSAGKTEETRTASISGSDAVARDSVQQESEAIRYLEDVLQESENCTKSFSNQRIMDDSDTDSLKDEGEVISVCQAEVHANANDQDSSDSIVEPPTVVTPDPVMLPKSSFAPLSIPQSQPEGYEAVDASADDSGISHSLNSDADSSVPSMNSDLKTMSDSGCHEEIYCNVSGGVISSSYSSPVISSPRTGVEKQTHVPIPLPRMSLKRKVLTSMESLNSSIYPSCDSLDVKSVPSDEFSVQGSTLESEKTDGNSAKDSTMERCSDDQNTDENRVATLCVANEKQVSENINRVEKEELEISSEVTVAENVTEEKIVTKSVDESIISKVEGSITEQNKEIETKCDNSDKNSISSSLSTESAHNSASHTPQIQKKLNNFAMGCYRKDENIDIYSIPSPEQKATSGISNNQSPLKDIQAPVRKNRHQPDVKILSFKDRNQKEIVSESGRSIVSEKRAQLSSMNTLPLTGRSTSLVNLTPQKALQKAPSEMEKMEEEVVNGNMKRTHSDQNVVKELEPVQLKETFLQEQRRLQEEYRRLQEQFISWQKQLLSNQSLLQNEKIVPQMPFPSLEGLSNLDSNLNIISESQISQNSETNLSSTDLRTRSLPRPKTKPLSVKEMNRPKTPPLAQPPVETAVVDIDINAQKPVKRPETLNACSVDTQASCNQEDKVVQVPPPQDKVTQVPSPQEKVTSGTQAPSPENVLNKDTSAQTSDNLQVSSTDVSSNSLSSPESDNSKSQTLPRPKPKPLSALPPSQTMTLNRNTRPKSQIVSVTIGSWQQRQKEISDVEPSSSVASTRSKFLSLENIPQNTNKPGLSTMEKRKLPPVPTEVDSTPKEVPKTVPKSVEAKVVVAAPKTEPTNVKTKFISDEKPVLDAKPEQIHKKPSKIASNDTKVLKTVPKQVEETNVKQSSDIRLASREPTATFKSAKPFVKLTSMKDEPHPPSIVGLKKWPLSDMSESRGATEGKQSILEDLKASSKRPGGYVQDKIRRAEVDLRKPKSTKTEPSSTSKPSKQENTEASKLHITKVNVNAKPAVDINATIPKEANIASGPGVTTTNSNTYKSNTIPKSQSLNSELMSVFSKKAAKNSEKLQQNTAQTVTVNGSGQSVPPPPPPPPPAPQASSSVMPTIPPAEQIPVSSQLVMARETKTLPASKKESKKSPSKHSKTVDPREELMLEIRGFGGKQALRKAPVSQAGWHLKVFGTASTANT
ncbi:Cordon-bleu protein-like 1 like protein [Argiope bruennichi]|uniref:Cordon-bleu protein-like 1 like protein n=1 Tax=Argiope bruennichi TaxID=94029 RepID=A0A8T0G336_ARGBR|nr:Cordon-bleu protein-like 1 like protein [Argiope bruennichi]